LQESLVPLLQGQQENFLHLDLPEDALMNEQEMQEIQNKEDDIPMDWQGNGHVVVNDIHLGMVRIFPSFTPSNPYLARQSAPIVYSLGNSSVALPKKLGRFFQNNAGVSIPLRLGQKVASIFTP